MKTYDVIVIGGGQSRLAVGYYLRRTGLSYVILDKNRQAGGAWIHTWKSLGLFSPAQWSSLPGMTMNGGSDYYPSRDEAIEYLKSYESKYSFPMNRAAKNPFTLCLCKKVKFMSQKLAKKRDVKLPTVNGMMKKRIAKKLVAYAPYEGSN